MGIAPGSVTILIAHILFCLSFVVVTVKARIASLDPVWSRRLRTCSPTRCRPSCG